MAMDKITDINLETTANFQPKSNLNVRFWNQDTNTAVLRFLITRNGFPLSLSTENVKVIIALESGENFIASDEFVYDTEVDGVVHFTIPTNFMSVATAVTGQVYVTTVDGEEVVVERQFTFDVSADLLATIPSEEQIRYIKMFDDLKQEVKDRITALENEFMVMEDYVAEVQQATSDGLTALTNLFNSKTVEYNNNHADKMTLINDTVGDYVQDFLDQRTYIDTQYNDFKNQLLQSDVVLEGETTNWQKYKMVKDDGTRTYLTKGSFPDVAQLAPGYYETVTADTPTQGFPSGVSNAAFVEIDITQSGSGRKQLKVVQSSNSKTYVKYIHTDGLDNGWKQVAIVDDLASLETATGSAAKANTAESNAKVYADGLVSAQRATLFSGSVSNVNSNINLTQSMDNFKILVVAGSYSGGNFTEVIVVSNLGSGHPIQRVNMSNATGAGMYGYEMELSKESSTRLKIVRDSQYSVSSDTGTINANNFTIKTIEGIK